MKGTSVGFAMCGSFCTFSKAIKEMRALSEIYDIVPIMSEVAYSKDTRFGKSTDFIEEVESITGKKIIKTIEEAEPIGPKKMCDLIIVAPCTGNTAAKIANGITDTSVTMAVKSHLRILRPVLLSVATNDGLGTSAMNIGKLLNTKNIYLTPMTQDDIEKKPNSLVSDFSKITLCAEKALKGIQCQPVFT